MKEWEEDLVLMQAVDNLPACTSLELTMTLSTSVLPLTLDLVMSDDEGMREDYLPRRGLL